MNDRHCLFWDPHQPIDTATLLGEVPGAASSPSDQLTEPVIVVIPSTYSSYHQLDLNKIPTHQFKAAIPNLLEDDCLEDIDTVAFGWSKTSGHYYTVMMLNRTLMGRMVDTLSQQQFKVVAICSDLLPQPTNQAYVGANHTNLCGDKAMGGVSSSTLLQLLDDKFTDINTWHCFADSDPHVIEALQQASAHCQTHLVNFNDFVHSQLQLSQLPHISVSNTLSGWRQHRWQWGIATILTLTVVGWLGLSINNLSRLHHTNHRLAQQNLSIFRQFFPQAKKLVNPKFQIQQKLKSAGQTTSDQTLRRLKTMLMVIHDSPVKLERFSYRQSNFDIYFSGANADTLANLQHKLEQAMLVVKPIETHTQSGRFIAHWQVH